MKHADEDSARRRSSHAREKSSSSSRSLSLRKRASMQNYLQRSRTEQDNGLPKNMEKQDKETAHREKPKKTPRTMISNWATIGLLSFCILPQTSHFFYQLSYITAVPTWPSIFFITYHAHRLKPSAWPICRQVPCIWGQVTELIV